MNVLIYTPSEHTREIFIEHLIPAGHTVYHTELEWDVVNQMILHDIDFLIVDLDRLERKTALKVIQEVKTHPKKRIRKGICLLYRHDIQKSELTQFLRAGVTGYISSEIPEDKFAAVIEQNWERQRSVPPERRFARAVLNPDIIEERVEVKMPVEDKIKPIDAVATDISAGGIAIKILDWPDGLEITKGYSVTQMTFTLIDYVCHANAVVVEVKKPYVALRFTALSDEDIHELSHFIFLRLSHYI